MWRIPEEPEIPEDAAEVNECMSQYLDDQSSITSYSHVAMGWSTNGARTTDWVSEHGSIVSSRRSGSITVLSPQGRLDHCGMLKGCGREGSPVHFKN